MKTILFKSKLQSCLLLLKWLIFVVLAFCRISPKKFYNIDLRAHSAFKMFFQLEMLKSFIRMALVKKHFGWWTIIEPWGFKTWFRNQFWRLLNPCNKLPFQQWQIQIHLFAEEVNCSFLPYLLSRSERLKRLQTYFEFFFVRFHIWFVHNARFILQLLTSQSYQLVNLSKHNYSDGYQHWQLWSLSLDSQHHSAIYWAKEMTWEHYSPWDSCVYSQNGQPL